MEDNRADVWLNGNRFGNGIVEIEILGRNQPAGGSFLAIIEPYPTFPDSESGAGLRTL